MPAAVAAGVPNASGAARADTNKIFTAWLSNGKPHAERGVGEIDPCFIKASN